VVRRGTLDSEKGVGMKYQFIDIMAWAGVLFIGFFVVALLGTLIKILIPHVAEMYALIWAASPFWTITTHLAILGVVLIAIANTWDTYV